MDKHGTPVEPDAPPPAPSDPLDEHLPAIAIAGAVMTDEELASLTQMALITRWLRLFSHAANGSGTRPLPRAVPSRRPQS